MYRYQTFGSRFLAAIIDGVVLSLFTGLLIKNFLPIFHNPIWDTIIDDACFYFYSIFLHYKYGQTLGKKITNVKVVSNDDETKLIGLSNSFKCDSVGILLSILDIVLAQFDIIHSNFAIIMFFISNSGWVTAELITMLFNEKKRAIHDFLANSVVIDVKVYPELQATGNTK